MGRFFAPLCLTVALSLTAASADSLFGPTNIDKVSLQASKEPLDDLIKDAPHQHPAAMMILAKRLFDAGRRDDAVFWFYEGQLRWRAILLNTNPDGHPIFNGEEDHYEVLFSEVGPDINQYAFGDTAALLKTLDAVLDWDANHPDDFTPAGKAKDDVRAGLKKFKDYIVAHKDEIAAKHAEEQRQESANSSPDDRYSGNGGLMMGTPAAMVKPYDAGNFSAFHAGKTTKAEVVQALGPPEAWDTDKDGNTTLRYSYNKSSPGLSMIGMVQRVFVSLKFDPKRILTGVELPDDKMP